MRKPSFAQGREGPYSVSSLGPKPTPTFAKGQHATAMGFSVNITSGQVFIYGCVINSL